MASTSLTLLAETPRHAPSPVDHRVASPKTALIRDTPLPSLPYIDARPSAAALARAQALVRAEQLAMHRSAQSYVNELPLPPHLANAYRVATQTSIGRINMDYTARPLLRAAYAARAASARELVSRLAPRVWKDAVQEATSAADVMQRDLSSLRQRVVAVNKRRKLEQLSSLN